MRPQFFFPICHQMHYYVVYINIKNKNAMILDNSNAADDKDIKVTYGDVPHKLVCVDNPY